MRLFGVDGCHAGWIVAESDLDLAVCSFHLVRDLSAWMSTLDPRSVLIAIDVPIGLDDEAPRACDQKARQRLGVPRQNSVFSAPCRGTLDASNYGDACMTNRELRGKGISRQLWGIVPKIQSVDRVLAELPAIADHVWEAHPEVTFADLAGSPAGLEAGKATPTGEALRRALLGAYGLQVNPVTVRASIGLAFARRDDILDAAACLLTAKHLADDTVRLYPQSLPEPRDGVGRRMVIAS
jgi:predicted RNase H-like nuclease